jgi:4-diphosphocytidyl-2-C-methyl-D-erythritol kinase
MIKIKAPAKINLTLEVVGKRPDGFHEIKSVLQAIDLYDTLQIEKGRGFTFQCPLPAWSAEKSLLSRVSSLLPADLMGGATVKIEKNIPLMSGLGGDSSDAAALLKGLNELYELNISDNNLHKIANELGSDVPFFLKGGTALAEGKGEKLTPLPPAKKFWVVLLFPDIAVEPGKTAKMYAALKPSSFSDGVRTKQLVEALKRGKPIEPGLLYNAFEDIVLDVYPDLSYYIRGCIRQGIPIHLAGAGPTLFAIFPDAAGAKDFYNICREHNAKAHIAETV